MSSSFSQGPNLKHPILIPLFKVRLDILRFAAFESQKSDHGVLFHCSLSPEPMFEREKVQTWPDLIA
jgi:hypothetical protein